MKKVRKGTKFHVCSAHNFMNGLGRKRRAEFFCEGGPTNAPCTPDDPCRIWPGTDLFNPDCSTGEATWPAEWPVNEPKEETA